MSFIHNLRRGLHFADRMLSRWDLRRDTAEAEPPRDRYDEFVSFLRSLDFNPDARRYLEIHMRRIARTLTLVPPPRRSKRALELGTYMQMAPALGCVLGYEDVRGAYFGKIGRVDEKTVSAGGKEIFRCLVDLFDAERDRFPYDDERFETVLACEIFEHMLLDPMHMLLEIGRVLEDDGTLVLTTPNVASHTAVARILEQSGNPQLFSMYPNPNNEYRDTEIPHVREYTPLELREAAESAGFEVEYLFTEGIAGYNSHVWVRHFLERNNYSPAYRGEQMYLVARKRAGKPIRRYPPFLYEGC